MLFLCHSEVTTKFKAKDSYYDKEYADFAVAFIESLCHTKGTWVGKWFKLMDWQEQIIRDLFGILKPNGYRQFNTAYIEIPKKNGKSELAAAVALLLTCGDGEQRAEVYGAAADRQQASIVFDVAAEEYGSKFYTNGASPSGVLEHPGTLKDPSKVRDSWNAAFAGSGNSHRVAVLEEGLKYTPISISPNEAQFLETRKFQIDEIARIFRVPPHMVGDLEKSSFSNIEQQSLEFVKYTLEPWIVRWEQSIFRSLLSRNEKSSYFVKFNVDGLLRGDYASRMSGYATARQNGWMLANDIRELENLDRISDEEGGNLYLVNGSMTKLSDAGAFAEKNNEKEENTNGEKVLELEKIIQKKMKLYKEFLNLTELLQKKVGLTMMMLFLFAYNIFIAYIFLCDILNVTYLKL